MWLEPIDKATRSVWYINGRSWQGSPTSSLHSRILLSLWPPSINNAIMTAPHAPFICTKTFEEFSQEIYKIQRVLGEEATEYLGVYPNFEALEKVEKQLCGFSCCTFALGSPASLSRARCVFSSSRCFECEDQYGGIPGRLLTLLDGMTFSGFEEFFRKGIIAQRACAAIIVSYRLFVSSLPLVTSCSLLIIYR